MLRHVFVTPLTDLFLVYPDARTPAELWGTAFWLVVLAVIFSWMLSATLYHVFYADVGRDRTVGVEAGIRLAWGLSYACMALLVGTYTLVLGGLIALREASWGGLMLLLPHLGVTLLLLLFSYLSFRRVNERVI
jgi:hypothetical protein